MMGLTQRQSECLRFIEGSIRERGFAPSFQEIVDAFGMKSKSFAHRIVLGLEARGHIRRLSKRARAIEVVTPTNAATAWPMGEAPKNGTWILAFSARGNWQRISWGRNFKGEMCWCTSDHLYWFEPERQFTHWMPMPPVVLANPVAKAA